MTKVDRDPAVHSVFLTAPDPSSSGQRVVDHRPLRDLLRRQEEIAFQVEHLLSNAGPSAADSSHLDLLAAREWARHHGEWCATRSDLQKLVTADRATLVMELETGLTSLSCLAVHALTEIRQAGTRSASASDLDPGGRYLGPAAEALRSVLAAHLALEVLEHGAPGQGDR